MPDSASIPTVTEELQRRLVTMLDYAGETAKHGIDAAGDLTKSGANFVAEQTPLLIKEFILWNFLSSCFLAGMCLILMCLSIWLAKWVWKQVDGWAADDAELVRAFSSVICTAGAGVCLAFFFVNAHTAIKVKAAPRVYIVEWAAEQMRGNRR